MKKHEKYLEVLKTLNEYVTIKEWANEFAKMYPNDIKNSEKNEKDIIRGLVKSITSLVSTGKWSNMLLIDQSIKPKKIKYNIDNTSKNDINNKIHKVDNPRNSKTINFKDLMKAIEYLSDDDDLLHRDQYTHFEKNGQYVGHKEYIAFQMAIRNKNVIEISKKLDYIDKTIENYQLSNDFRDWLRGIEYWEDMFEGEAPEFTINSEQKKEYMFIATLPLTKFTQEIDFLNIETEYTNDEKFKDTISLKSITDYLQEQLVQKYHIYKDGYYFIKDNDYFDPDEVIDSDSIFKHDFNTYTLEDDFKLIIDKLLNRKQENMNQTADMFFMYDYFNKRKELGNLNLSALDIKCELTKYYGITIEGFKEKFSYEECLERYEEFKTLNASFHDVEKTITNKIKYMEKFIDQELYKFILFY